MIIWIEELGMQILIWLLGLVDSVFTVFRGVAGLESVTTPGGKQTVGEYFMNLDGVQWAFWVVFIASIGICAVCTVAAVIKNIIGKNGEHRSHAKVIGKSLSTAIVSFVMAALLITGMTCADKMLGAVDKAINHGETMIMSHEIIDASVGGGYMLDLQNVQKLNEYDENGNRTFTAYMYEFEKDSNGDPKYYSMPDNPHLIKFIDSSTGVAFSDYTQIYTKKKNDKGEPMTDAYGYPAYKLNFDKLTPIKDPGGGWMPDLFSDSGYHSKKDLKKNIWDEDVEHILGDDHWVLVPVPVDWKYDGLVNPDSFSFLTAYICTFIVLSALIHATLGLVKRLYDIVLLFIALPGIAATIPLDDGAKFKLWRETVISKIFLAFGTVLAVNIFGIVAPQIWGMHIDGSRFVNSLLKTVLICGGAMSISGGQLLMARLLGTSAEESREMAQAARSLMGGAATVYGVGKAAGRGLFGTKNAYGQRVGGLIKGGAGVAGAVGGGAINAVGGAIGGQAYRGSRFGRGVSATQRALSGFSQSGGWFGKDRMNPDHSYTLGSGIGKGMHSIGGKFSGNEKVRRSGLNNGLVGAVRAPIDRKHTANRQNAKDMIAQGSESLDAAYGSAEAARNAAPLRGDFGREVLAGFEGDTPSTLPTPVDKTHKG